MLSDDESRLIGRSVRRRSEETAALAKHVDDEREKDRRDDRDQDHREASESAAERPDLEVASDPHLLIPLGCSFDARWVFG